MDKRVEKIFILMVDFISINLTLMAFFYLRVESGWFQVITEPVIFLAMIAIYFYWVLMFTIVGMYRTWFAASRFDELSTLFKTSFVGIFILFSLIMIDDSMHGVASSTRYFIFIYWGIFLLFVGIGRLFIRGLQRKLLINGFGRKNAVLIGFNAKSMKIHDMLEKHRALGLDVKSYIALKVENIGKEYKGIRVSDSVNELSKIIDEQKIQSVIIALDKKDDDVILEVLSKCDSPNISIKMVPDLYEIISGQARTSQIYGVPLIDVMPQLMPEWEKKLKRVMDILVSIILLLIASPALIITMIAIKLESKGPIIYKQERSGMNGKPFNVYKFRSMIQDAEKYSGPVWSQKNDPRITKAGRLIRKLRIDEFPQMMNVLKGEMSLVGPRPERPYFVEKLAQEIPLYKRRLKVRPGITGWAQVKHKYDESIEDVKAKLSYDLFYIENMSIRMDFKILFRTIFTVLLGKGHFE
ncbi:MAG: sugar transferase [bacterium]